MNARKKLNNSYAHGCFLIAGLAGWAFESWWIFAIVLVVLFSCSLHSGDIRPHDSGLPKSAARISSRKRK